MIPIEDIKKILYKIEPEELDYLRLEDLDHTDDPIAKELKEYYRQFM